MKVKREHIVKLWKTIEILGQQKQKTKFGYFMIKNKNRIKEEVESLHQIITPNQGYLDYETKRTMLAQSMAEKDDSGQPIVINQSYSITTNMEEFDTKMLELKAEYKDVITEYEVAKTEYNELLKEEIDFDGYKIELDNMSDEIEPLVIELFMKLDLIIEDD